MWVGVRGGGQGGNGAGRGMVDGSPTISRTKILPAPLWVRWTMHLNWTSLTDLDLNPNTWLLNWPSSFYQNNELFLPQTATCFFSSNGLKVTVENSKCIQANAFIQTGIFQEFTFKDDSATFRINLNTLMVGILISYV